MNNKFDEVKSKIAKLLALANDGCNDHESQTALLMARKLMAQYNLEMSDIDSEVKREVDEYLTDVTFSKQRDAWIGRLAHVIAGAHRCEVLLSVRYGCRTYKVKFVGFKEDLELATVIFKAAYTYVQLKIDSLWRTYEKQGYPIRTLRSIIDSYGIGFAEGLSEKYAEQNAQEEACSALMVVTPEDVRVYRDQVSSGAVDTSSNHRVDSQAYGIGFSEGKVFSPNYNLESPKLKG